MSGDYASYNHPLYLRGRPYAICDRCSFKYRHDELRKEWTSLMVCNKCYDPKPAQLEAPNVSPEGVPIENPRPDIEQSGPNNTTPGDL